MGRSLQKEITQPDFNNAFQRPFIKCSCLPCLDNTKLLCLLYLLSKSCHHIRDKPNTDIHKILLANISMFHFFKKYLDLLWPQSKYSSACFLLVLCSTHLNASICCFVTVYVFFHTHIGVLCKN